MWVHFSNLSNFLVSLEYITIFTLYERAIFSECENKSSCFNFKIIYHRCDVHNNQRAEYCIIIFPVVDLASQTLEEITAFVWLWDLGLISSHQSLLKDESHEIWITCRSPHIKNSKISVNVREAFLLCKHLPVKASLPVMDLSLFPKWVFQRWLKPHHLVETVSAAFCLFLKMQLGDSLVSYLFLSRILLR